MDIKCINKQCEKQDSAWLHGCTDWQGKKNCPNFIPEKPAQSFAVENSILKKINRRLNDDLIRLQHENEELRQKIKEKIGYWEDRQVSMGLVDLSAHGEAD
jgi:V8-like Glu-specific endopeptidase